MAPIHFEGGTASAQKGRNGGGGNDSPQAGQGSNLQSTQWLGLYVISVISVQWNTPLFF